MTGILIAIAAVAAVIVLIAGRGWVGVLVALVLTVGGAVLVFAGLVPEGGALGAVLGVSLGVTILIAGGAGILVGIVVRLLLWLLRG